MSPHALREAAAATSREQQIAARRLGYTANVTQLPDKLGAIAAAVAVFTEQGVSYALIGGLAVGIHSGVPRATLDVDFALPTTIDREAVARRLIESGFSQTGVFAHSTNFRHSSGEPMQLAFDPLFDDMIARARVLQFDDLALAVVTREDLITMKKLAAADPGPRRSKALRDAADVALLEGDVPDPDEGW